MTPTRREGRCPWLREAIAEGETDAPQLIGKSQSDICIVGGGLAGLWTAIELQRQSPGLSISIVEADICGGGASGRNSGMVLSQWAKFAALEAFGGSEDAIRLGHAFAGSAAFLREFCAAEDIDAEIRGDGWIWGATCKAHMGAWNCILATLARHDLHPFRGIDAPTITAMTGSQSFMGGIYDPEACTLHPGKLVRGLRRAALRRGIAIYENSPMTELKRASPVEVITAKGSITAERVVLTMNAWSLAIPELRSGIVVMTSDDAVTAPVPDRLKQAGYFEKPLMGDSQTFVTGFRSTKDHRFNPGISGGVIGFGRLGFGQGAGHRFEGRSSREQAIHEVVKRGHPALADIPFAESWCGPIDRTRSGLPLFGPLPGHPDIFYGYGFSGNGLATTPVAGRILASLALGKRNEWSSCGLVRTPERWLPPEPIRYIGAHMVRAAIRRKDAQEQLGRAVDPVSRGLSAFAPGGITTSRPIKSKRGAGHG
ncbi:FAD-dependent oxidoreductase [Aestuariivirga sp.]|uniref:FAD-dependent oxidoreductase n=1 Tax=Aestuariivirga sp. TaxID=2650926 RepID=UPI0039E4B391